jgi:hypothetical protein
VVRACGDGWRCSAAERGEARACLSVEQNERFCRLSNRRYRGYRSLTRKGLKRFSAVSSGQAALTPATYSATYLLRHIIKRTGSQKRRSQSAQNSGPDNN